MGLSQPTRSSYPYELNPDIDAGLEQAVRNSQTILALQYMRLIAERDRADIEALRAEVDELKSGSSSSAKKATAPKAKTETPAE